MNNQEEKTINQETTQEQQELLCPKAGTATSSPNRETPSRIINLANVQI